jgi:hypothetical protein
MAFERFDESGAIHETDHQDLMCLPVLNDGRKKARAFVEVKGQRRVQAIG